MLQRVIQSSVKWTHTQCMYVHRARGKLAKSMFVIHTHRQLIMIIHWSWSEYVLLTSPGSGLACFSQHFNATFPWFRAKHYGLWTPSGSADIKLVWNFWFKSCSWFSCRLSSWRTHSIQEFRERQRLEFKRNRYCESNFYVAVFFTREKNTQQHLWPDSCNWKMEAMNKIAIKSLSFQCICCGSLNVIHAESLSSDRTPSDEWNTTRPLTFPSGGRWSRSLASICRFFF